MPKDYLKAMEPKKRQQLPKEVVNLRNDFFAKNNWPTNDELHALHDMIAQQPGCTFYSFKKLQHWLEERQKKLKLDFNLFEALQSCLQACPDPTYSMMVCWAETLHLAPVQIFAMVGEIQKMQQNMYAAGPAVV
ncbi:hypothetical protein A0H81_10096 [Grifola frondosa]|uniref:Uncharacterized protein n=1 Tax=Grifola frondosa TaxID=5627 RepID=A0A1C7LYP2_GRIFR|nr:hypothetical protein A0H81_10096 [Grifola frondosa]